MGWCCCGKKKQKVDVVINASTVENADVNILLLGESGVGKSTFINALANYLKFDNIEQAQKGPPIALIPVSFIITEGDDFNERIIQFGNQNQNEDFDHPGQSVTQQCKTYPLSISTTTKCTINIIDTPGIGDTRGFEQDDLNIQNIMSYIDKLPHLNAICILLKPNESKLNVVLRSYFTQLIGLLGENACENIVFCFTNTRGTFYSPGNTGPLLRQMLNDLPIKQIPFGKLNTFCFDSESFRYLIARLDGVAFDDFQRKEYEQSWTVSMEESNRFLSHICTQLKPYVRKNWQSIEHARYKIKQIIEPLLKTIRDYSQETSKTNKEHFDKLRQACAQFGSFLLSTNRSSELDDPIYIYLNRMINEEQNEKISEQLNKIKDDYEKQRRSLVMNTNSVNLPRIYELMQEIRPLITNK